MSHKSYLGFSMTDFLFSLTSQWLSFSPRLLIFHNTLEKYSENDKDAILIQILML